MSKTTKKIADMNCPKCGKKFKRYPMTLKQWEGALRVHLISSLEHMGKFTPEEVKSIIEKHLKSFGSTVSLMLESRNIRL